MKKEDLIFDERGDCDEVVLANQAELISICMNIDYIEKEEIELIFKDVALNIINNSNLWYDKVINYVKKETNSKEIEVACIYIHNFQKEGRYIFGLSFISGLEIYAEHGIGMNLTVDDYEILEFGDEEVSFIINGFY